MESKNMKTCPVHKRAYIDNCMNIRYELSTIFIISFVQSVQDGLSQVFIEPIVFTVENISDEIISQHCCGIRFCVKC